MWEIVLHVAVSLSAGAAGAYLLPIIQRRFRTPTKIAMPDIASLVKPDNYRVERHGHTSYDGTDRLKAEEMWAETKGAVIYKNNKPRGTSEGLGAAALAEG